MKAAKSDVDGGHAQAKLFNTICELKNEMEANAALPAVAGGKEGKMGTGLQAINSNFQLHKSIHGELTV